MAKDSKFFHSQQLTEKPERSSWKDKQKQATKGKISSEPLEAAKFSCDQ
jgi:hypothetical protein